VEDIAKNETQQRFAEKQAAEQNGSEQSVDNRRFQLDKVIIVQPYC